MGERPFHVRLLIHWDANIPLISKFLQSHQPVLLVDDDSKRLLYQVQYGCNRYWPGPDAGHEVDADPHVGHDVLFLNSYPAGLNYYYFLSTLFTIGFTLLFKQLLNEVACPAGGKQTETENSPVSWRDWPKPRRCRRSRPVKELRRRQSVITADKRILTFSIISTTENSPEELFRSGCFPLWNSPSGSQNNISPKSQRVVELIFDSCFMVKVEK